VLVTHDQEEAMEIGGEPAIAQLTRGQTEQLELAPGEIVYVRWEGLDSPVSRTFVQ
jgi:ABC-type sulfate/molybdate transport systems ATPase subunit